MNKIMAIGIAGGILLVFVVWISARPGPSAGRAGVPEVVGGQSRAEAVRKADRIEVVHFHATQQCWSCSTVGAFAKKTVETRFPEEHAAGRIVFMDVNADLEQNRELARKFKASGSSLFINAIAGGEDRIAEDVTVWRLVSDERRFIQYLEGVIRKQL